MPYESAFLGQADLKKSFGSTLIERKQMSTKTSFKRIALVAVSALGFGVLSAVAPASASVSTAEATPCYVSTAEYGAKASGETATATMTATQVAGAANYVVVTCGSDIASGSTGVVSATGGVLSTFADGTGTDASWTVATGGASATSANVSIAGTTFRVSTPTVGAVTVTIAKRVISNGAATDTTLQTITITVGAATTNVYSAANSTVYAAGPSSGTAEGTTPSSTTDAAVLLTAPAISKSSASTVEALKIVVDQEDANDVNLTTAVVNSVTITGVGSVGVAVDTPLGQYVAETAQGSDFYIFADGRAGQSSIAVSVNGVVVKTYIVNFYGAVATLTASTEVTHIAPGATTTGVIEVVAKDANGVIVPDVTITGEASSSTAITAVTPAGDGDSDGDQLVGLTTASTAAGTYTITFEDGQATPIVSNAVTVTVGKTTAATVTLTTDKEIYLPGEKVTLTVTATDSNGNGVADGSRALFSSAGVTSSTSLQGSLPASAVTLASGVATYTVYAPLASGTVTLTATEGTATDSTTKGTITGSIVVGKTNAETAAEAAEAAAKKAGEDAVEAASAATDAAAEAIDAANAATDAANLAAEAADAATVAAEEARDAADAATAAVEELATQVATLMAALKAQITTLANTVAKIAKKVKA
jgi:hypothetical protein